MQLSRACWPRRMQRGAAHPPCRHDGEHDAVPAPLGENSLHGPVTAGLGSLGTPTDPAEAHRVVLPMGSRRLRERSESIASGSIASGSIARGGPRNPRSVPIHTTPRSPRFGSNSHNPTQSQVQFQYTQPHAVPGSVPIHTVPRSPRFSSNSDAPIQPQGSVPADAPVRATQLARATSCTDATASARVGIGSL